MDPGLEAAHFAFRQQAMGVLLAWSVLNLVVGGAGALLAKRRPLKIFFGANAAWNIVNLAIAGGGLASALGHELGTLEGPALLREMVFFRDVLLVNVGLDVAYVSAGVLTWMWGRDRAGPWRTAVGQALVLQGAFLFVFDLVLTVMLGAPIDAGWTALG